MPSYEIIITKTTVEDVESGGNWQQVGEEPLTEDDYRQSIYDGSLIPFISNGEIRLKKVFGYTPKIVKSKTITAEIYRQTVSDIDLPAIIKAVNKM